MISKFKGFLDHNSLVCLQQRNTQTQTHVYFLHLTLISKLTLQLQDVYKDYSNVSSLTPGAWGWAVYLVDLLHLLSTALVMASRPHLNDQALTHSNTFISWMRHSEIQLYNFENVFRKYAKICNHFQSGLQSTLFSQPERIAYMCSLFTPQSCAPSFYMSLSIFEMHLQDRGIFKIIWNSKKLYKIISKV